jgi:hypothetical protein
VSAPLVNANGESRASVGLRAPFRYLQFCFGGFEFRPKLSEFRHKALEFRPKPLEFRNMPLEFLKMPLGFRKKPLEFRSRALEVEFQGPGA